MSRDRAIKKLERLRDAGVNDSEILEYIIENFLDGTEAEESLDAYAEQFSYDIEDSSPSSDDEL